LQKIFSLNKLPKNVIKALQNKEIERVSDIQLLSPTICANGVKKVIYGNRWQPNSIKNKVLAG